MKKISQISHPTIFHVTHWKAGSQWINKILREAALDRIVQPLVGERQFLEMPIVNGGVYPTVYLTKEQFFSIALPERYRKFVVIRDLRDTLISAYYSIRYSHALIDERLVLWRNKLEIMTVEQGLFMLLDEWLPMCAAIQKSWLESGEKCIRYEDLLSNDAKILEELLIDHCELSVDRGRLQEIIVENRFETLTGGRKPGDENKMAHERKGVAGDWRHHFTLDLTKEFNSRYSSLLIAGCYPVR